MVPYDKRTGKIWYNSELVDWADAKIHVLNHGLHYASCVFEGESLRWLNIEIRGTYFKTFLFSKKNGYDNSLF